MTAAALFPLLYTLYEITFDENADDLIVLWPLIAIPWTIVCSVPYMLLTYTSLITTSYYIASILQQKLMISVLTIISVAVTYVSVFGFKNDITYSVLFVFCYTLVLIGCIWVYRLKPIAQSSLSTHKP
jgi:hypothetical protein